METYDNVTVALKTNDANYIIHEIKGFRRFLSHRECLSSRDVVPRILKKIFSVLNSHFYLKNYWISINSFKNI